MKSLKKGALYVMGIALSMFVLTSCGGNSSSNNGGGNDSGNQEQFSTVVHQFDSSWQQRVQTLNASIAKWDSSAQSNNSEQMEEKIQQIKDSRDSFVNFIGKSKAQTEDSWNDFKQSTIQKYKEVVDSINSLSK